MEEEADAGHRRPLLRQHSSPLPPPTSAKFGEPIGMARQTSVPTPPPHLHSKAGRASDGDNTAFGVALDESVSGSGGGITSKKSSLARFRALGSMRGTRLNMDLSSSSGDNKQQQGLDSTSAEAPTVTSEPPLSDNQRKYLLDRAIRYFNLNPKVGLKFIRDKRLVSNKRDPADVVARKEALFLKTTRGLNKVKVGQILCSEAAILREYLSLFDFQSYEPNALGVERGLRDMLHAFKPGGEGQQLERLMEAFAERFALCSEPKLSKDAILTVAIMILMLNTSLHNPNNRQGILRTKDEFVSIMFKEPSVKDAVSLSELSLLFDNIQRDEIRHDDDRDDLAGNLFSDPEMIGWLDVKMYSAGTLFPRIQARWKRRYVILSQNVLYLFKRSTDVDFKGFIALDNLRLLIENLPAVSPASSSTALNSPHPASPTAEIFHPPTQRLLQRHLDEQQRQQDNAASSNRRREGEEAESAEKDEALPRKSVPPPPPLRMAALASCPTFRTSQSSMNSSSYATTTATTTTSSRSSRLFAAPFKNLSSSRGEHTFILAPASPNFFVKSARLAKRRNKKRNGEVIAQQNLYVAFRTRDRAEHDRWVRTLKDTGLLRSKAVVSFYHAISDRSYWAGTGGKIRLLSPTFSLPTSFSDVIEAEEQDFTTTTTATQETTSVGAGGSFSAQQHVRIHGVIVEGVEPVVPPVGKDARSGGDILVLA